MERNLEDRKINTSRLCEVPDAAMQLVTRQVHQKKTALQRYFGESAKLAVKAYAFLRREEKIQPVRENEVAEAIRSLIKNAGDLDTQVCEEDELLMEQISDTSDSTGRQALFWAAPRDDDTDKWARGMVKNFTSRKFAQMSVEQALITALNYYGVDVPDANKLKEAIKDLLAIDDIHNSSHFAVVKMLTLLGYPFVTVQCHFGYNFLDEMVADLRSINVAAPFNGTTDVDPMIILCDDSEAMVCSTIDPSSHDGDFTISKKCSLNTTSLSVRSDQACRVATEVEQELLRQLSPDIFPTELKDALKRVFATEVTVAVDSDGSESDEEDSLLDFSNLSAREHRPSQRMVFSHQMGEKGVVATNLDSLHMSAKRVNPYEARASGLVAPSGKQARLVTRNSPLWPLNVERFRN